MKKTVSRIWQSLLKANLVIMTIGSLLFFQLSINAGEGIIVAGVVETSILDKGEISSVKIDTRSEIDEVYYVVLNAAGKKLGQEMHGTWVEVIGSVYNEDGKNWVEVKRFEKVDFVE